MGDRRRVRDGARGKRRRAGARGARGGRRGVCGGFVSVVGGERGDKLWDLQGGGETRERRRDEGGRGREGWGRADRGAGDESVDCGA